MAGMLGQQQYNRAVAAGGGDAKKGYKTLASGGSQARSSGGGFNIGGLLGSLGSAYAARKAAQIARENREWQEKQNTIAYERSLPWSSQGPAGNVEFDAETKEIISTLSPEFQAQMQGFLGSSAMANEELQSMMGDPYAMEQEQMKRFDAFNADRDRRNQQQADELAFSQGLGGTQEYYRNLALGESVNQRRMQEELQSMGTGMDYRQMLLAESLGMGDAARNTAGMLNTQADLGRMVGQGSHTGKNMLGVQAGGENYADTQSAFWSGMLDQGAKYNPNTGVKTADAKPGLFSNLFNLGRKGYSMMTDKSYIA